MARFRRHYRTTVRRWQATAFTWLFLVGLYLVGLGFEILTSVYHDLVKWSAQYSLLSGVGGVVIFVIIALCASLWFYFRTSVKPKLKPISYINEKGYVVLYQEDELEHRYIAKQILGRDLYQNEVVHHINGNKSENVVGNLCLMDSDKHEHFHSWLRWKKEKSGHYPSIGHQKNVLEREYGGTLLENLVSKQSTRVN